MKVHEIRIEMVQLVPCKKWRRSLMKCPPIKKLKENQLCEENTKKNLGLKRRRIKSIFNVCVQSFQNHLFIPKVLRGMIFEEKKKCIKLCCFAVKLSKYSTSSSHCVWSSHDKNMNKSSVQHQVAQVCNAECFQKYERQLFGREMRKSL